MPYYNKNRYPARKYKKRAYRKKTTKPNYNRKRLARIARPMTMRPVSAVQKVVYQNTFICKPGLSSTNTQQCFSFQVLLNSPWLFSQGWNNGSSGTNQSIVGNEAIVGLDASHHPTETTTIMPGVKVGGGTPFEKYQQGYVTGTKITLIATPIANASGTALQDGYFFAHKSSSASDIEQSTELTDLNKLPFVQMKRIRGIQLADSWTQPVSSRIVVKHSPKKYNNVKDLRDNKQLSFSTRDNSGLGDIPDELDFLTIGVIPALNSYVPANASGTNEAPCTNFQLQMRVEQSLLWTEPIDNDIGTSNLAYPIPSYRKYAGAAYMAGTLGAAFMGY